MNLTLAGVSFRLEVAGGFSEPERALLDRLQRLSGEDAREPWLIRLEAPSAAAQAEMQRSRDYGAATVEATAHAITLRHRRFFGTLALDSRTGVLYSPAREGAGLEMIIRVALEASLPDRGGLPLHAAGVVAGGCGVAFFGRSGAGKSTLARACPWPVLSDELVAVSMLPSELHATGFWGEARSSSSHRSPVPLRALVELDKGPRLRLERLEGRDALRSLVPVVIVPPAPHLWTRTLAVIGQVAAAVPIYRMQWNPAEAPWSELEGLLGIVSRSAAASAS
jgi:hypothetical protein